MPFNVGVAYCKAPCTKEFAPRILSIFTFRTQNPSRTRTRRISSAAGCGHEAHGSTLDGFHGRPNRLSSTDSAGSFAVRWGKGAESRSSHVSNERRVAHCLDRKSVV